MRKLNIFLICSALFAHNVFATYADEVIFCNNMQLKDAIDNLDEIRIEQILRELNIDLSRRIYKNHTHYSKVTLFSYLIKHKRFTELKTILEKTSIDISFCENIEQEIDEIFNHDQELFILLLQKTSYNVDLGKNWLNLLFIAAKDEKTLIKMIKKFSNCISKEMIKSDIIKEHMANIIKKEYYEAVYLLLENLKD